MLNSFAARVVTCQRCALRQKVCSGPCPCTVDGVDIIDHATAADCPKGYHSGDPLVRDKPDIPLAGDVVEAIAKRIGADRLAKLWERWTGAPCGCDERKQRLNDATERLMRWFRPPPASPPR